MVINVMIILSISMFIYLKNSFAIRQSWDCHIARIKIKSLLRVVAAILFLSFNFFFFSIITNYFMRYLLAFIIIFLLIIIFNFENKYLIKYIVYNQSFYTLLTRFCVQLLKFYLLLLKFIMISNFHIYFYF